MALLTLFLSLSTEHVVFFARVMCPCSFWTKRHANLLINNNKFAYIQYVCGNGRSSILIQNGAAYTTEELPRK